jgi:hypothetical protein
MDENFDWTKALGGLFSGAGQLAAAYLPYKESGTQIDWLKQQGPALKTAAETIGSDAATKAAFQPFTVTTGTGATTTVGADGGYTMALTPEEQKLQQDLFAQAQGAIGTATPTAQELYAQMAQMRSPEEERRRLELENRLRAQGRLGTQTSMFGGTPEALALEKAIQEQQSADVLSSITGASTLAGQNIANIQSLLGAAYSPEQQALAALTPAVNLANIAQSGRLGESEAMYRGGIAGLEAQTGALTGAAGLESARVGALAQALSGLFAGGYNPETGERGQSDIERLIGLLGG